MQTIKLNTCKQVKAAVMALGLLAMTGTSLVYAAPSSNVVWTIETRNLIRNADLENGEKLAGKKCAKCHGDDGTDLTPVEDEDTPYLSGQIAHANYKQMIDYLDKKRDDKTMRKALKNLSKQDIADISAFYETQALPLATVKTSTVTPEAIRMATRGSGERFLPPCAGCHGLNGEGSIVDVPALAGQSASYFVTTMMAYKEDDRENDIYSRMRFIAKELTEQEITELADYYASLGTYNPEAEELLEEEDEEGPEAPQSNKKRPDAPDAPDAPQAPVAPSR